MPEEIITGSRSLVLVSGFFLVSVAWNMSRRKKMAWLVTVWLLIISMVSYFFKGLDVEEISITIILLALLWYFRRDFTVKSDPTAFERLLSSAPVILALFCVYAIIGFYLLRGDYRPEFSLEKVIYDTINIITLQGSKYYTPTTMRATYFIDSINIVAGAVILNMGFNIMRPYIIPETTTWEKQLAREILKNHGYTTFSYFTLGDDKSYYFNEGSSAYVAYVVKQGVALAAGDPVGPIEEISGMVNGFKSFAEENGWVPVFNTVEERFSPIYDEAGFKLLKGGEEAIIDLTAWDMKGKAKEDLRTAYNKGKRLNWQFKVYDSEIKDETVINQIRAINEAWLREKYGGEMGFMMGITPIFGGSETLVATVSDGEGNLMAFMTLAPIYGRQGWIGDHVRRNEKAPNGVIDFLMVSLILTLKDQGFKMLSMGEAPLHGVGEQDSNRLTLERLMRLIYENFNSVYHYKQLYEYKAKWRPMWEDRFIAYPYTIAFPRIVVALAYAHMPNLTVKEIVKLLPID